MRRRFARIYFNLVYRRLDDATTACLLRYMQAQERLVDLFAADEVEKWLEAPSYEPLTVLLDDVAPERLALLVDEQLKAIDDDYRDIESYLGLQPVKVPALPPGTFDRYTERQRRAGADPAHLKPPRMNASERALETVSYTHLTLPTNREV